MLVIYHRYGVFTPVVVCDNRGAVLSGVGASLSAACDGDVRSVQRVTVGFGLHLDCRDLGRCIS